MPTDPGYRRPTRREGSRRGRVERNNRFVPNAIIPFQSIISYVQGSSPESRTSVYFHLSGAFCPIIVKKLNLYLAIADRCRSMNQILLKSKTLYQNTQFKRTYTWTLTGITFFLFILLPFFSKRTNLIVSVYFDLFVRLFITYSSFNSFHFIINLDQYYEKFYASTIPLTFPKPDGLKQIVNIFSAIFTGCCGGVFYNAILKFFIPNIGILSIVISFFIGLSLLLPLLSQYQKR